MSSFVSVSSDVTTKVVHSFFKYFVNYRYTLGQIWILNNPDVIDLDSFWIHEFYNVHWNEVKLRRRLKRSFFGQNLKRFQVEWKVFELIQTFWSNYTTQNLP